MTRVVFPKVIKEPALVLVSTAIRFTQDTEQMQADRLKGRRYCAGSRRKVFGIDDRKEEKYNEMHETNVVHYSISAGCCTWPIVQSKQVNFFGQPGMKFPFLHSNPARTLRIES